MATEIQHSTYSVNGIQMHVAEAGKGPLVLLCHGFPELSHSWRHQLAALSSAGFRAVAPDMRGYGQTSAPEDIATYSLFHLVGDMVALVGALGEREAVIVGHDWGAPVAWHAALFRPDIFRAVAALSVPYRGRGPAEPLGMLRAAGAPNYYWIYFQEPGVAEAELERDVGTTFRKLIAGLRPKGEERGDVLNVKPGGGFLDGMTDPRALPAWMREQDFAVFVREFGRTGFRGGLNWYRNISRNWEFTAPWHDAPISQPALFVAGTKDAVIAGERGAAAIRNMSALVPDLRTVLIEGAGHWIQQERPDEVNQALLEFLRRS